MNHYTDKTSGVRYSQREIDKLTKQAKKSVLYEQIEYYGYNYCEECKVDADNGIRIPRDMERKVLDCSHIKPVSKCKNDGDIELIFDVSNIDVLCRYHHKLRDKLT